MQKDSLSHLFLFFILGALSLHPSTTMAYSPYIDVGTSIGTLSGGDNFFGQTNAHSSSFVGALGIYWPISNPHRFTHFELGLNNRLTLAHTTTGKPTDMNTLSIAMRVEFFRFFVGAGYSPYAFKNKVNEGVTKMMVNPGASAYFAEGGAIWRVVPELQIVASLGLEMGIPKTGGTSPTSIDYGLHFRFPLNPTDFSAKSGVKFDGFRYPFGVMRD